MSTLVATITAKAVAVAVATSPPLAGRRADPESTTTVEVEASVVGRDALSARLEAEVSRLIDVVPLNVRQPVHISIEGELLGFEVRVSEGDRSTMQRCPCTHDELVTHVLQRVVVPPQCSPVRPAAVAVSCVSPPSREPPVAALDHARLADPPLSPPKAAGVALSVLGAATLSAGAGVWLGRVVGRNDFTRDAPDLRPYAIAAITSGAVALTVGAVLLLARPGARRRRSRARLSVPDRPAVDRSSVLR